MNINIIVFQKPSESPEMDGMYNLYHIGLTIKTVKYSFERTMGTVEFILIGRSMGVVEFILIGRTMRTVEFILIGRTIRTVEFILIGRSMGTVEFILIGRTMRTAEFILIGRTMRTVEFIPDCPTPILPVLYKSGTIGMTPT